MAHRAKQTLRPRREVPEPAQKYQPAHKGGSQSSQSGLSKVTFEGLFLAVPRKFAAIVSHSLGLGQYRFHGPASFWMQQSWVGNNADDISD